MAPENHKPKASKMAKARRICGTVHRHLGFFFAGIIVIYALSGIFMNHRRELNPSCTVDVKEITLPAAFPTQKSAVSKADIEPLLTELGEDGKYTKHYFVNDDMRVLLKGGSSVNVNMDTRTGTYERVRERFIIADMVKLHFNPGKWWTYFSDIFAICLIIITLTGLFILKGKKGIAGIGAVELVLGLVAPILFLLLF